MLAQGGGGSGDDPLPRLAREQGGPGRRDPCLRGFLPICGVIVSFLIMPRLAAMITPAAPRTLSVGVRFRLQLLSEADGSGGTGWRFRTLEALTATPGRPRLPLNSFE